MDLVGTVVWMYVLIVITTEMPRGGLRLHGHDHAALRASPPGRLRPLHHEGAEVQHRGDNIYLIVS